jgi:hypothetical protein
MGALKKTEDHGTGKIFFNAVNTLVTDTTGAIGGAATYVT